MFPSEHPRVNDVPPHRKVARVLVVDGDAALRADLVTSLTHAGHEVDAASTGESALSLARASRPDIVLFDLHLPDMNGADLCRALRTELDRRPSFCVLSAAKEEADRVAAFEAGVDDYVTKPHSMRELILRLRSLARRRSSAPPSDAIVVASLKIDRAARRVDLGGRPIDLTRREFDLLLHLAERAGRVQTRDSLVSSVWGEVPDSGRVVDTTIKRLRRKLGPTAPEIRTIRGVGYKLGE